MTPIRSAGFVSRLDAAQRVNSSLLCVGLDPDPNRIDCDEGRDRAAILEYLIGVVDATVDLVCAYKPQIAHFSALGAEAELTQLIAHIHSQHPHIPVILDAKRGDIGSTAERYAAEAFDRYGADAVTVNPYLGGDSLKPFLDRDDRGVVVICKTSNAGSGDFQDREIDGRPLYQHVAESAVKRWNSNGNVMLVVGATWPDQLRIVRGIVGDMPLLIPGVGAQGGDVAAVLAAGATSTGRGLVVNSARGILYADEGRASVAAARAAAEQLCGQLRSGAG